MLLFQFSPEDPGVGKAELVVVEFFGMPRLRAGRSELSVNADTVEDLLAAVEQSCPALSGLRQADGRLSPHYLLSINGLEFATEGKGSLRPGDRVLLLSADAGG